MRDVSTRFRYLIETRQMAGMLDEAIVTAAQYHAGQKRKGRIKEWLVPYIIHPIDVMKTVWTWGAGDPTLLAAAALHDTLEDTELSYEQILQAFGANVALLVRELTRDPDTALEDYHKHFLTSSISALVIVLADLCCNTNDYLLTDPAKAVTFFRKAETVVQAMKTRLPEISDKFGPETSQAILAAFAHLTHTLQAIIDSQ